MKYKGKDLMEYFPLESARGSQKAVLLEIDKAFDAGQKFIILEAPVGSGKSAIAMTLANAFDSAHIITPRKSLQNQYFDDFSEDVVLMKGRSSYPCTYQSDPHKYKAIIKHIENGMIQSPDWDEPNCSSAPCKNSNTVFRVCTEETGICPYSRAMEVAEDHPTVIHNLHSFIYQTNFSQRFTTRDIMIVDEAHEIESVIRGFITKKINVPKKFDETKVPVSSKSLNDWCNFLSSAECAPSISAM
jgi:Rad3-related DNA helicase